MLGRVIESQSSIVCVIVCSSITVGVRAESHSGLYTAVTVALLCFQLQLHERGMKLQQTVYSQVRRSGFN